MKKLDVYEIFIIGSLFLHVFYANSILLLDAQRILLESNAGVFKEPHFFKLIFAFSYSSVSILIMIKYVKLSVIVITGIFDGFAVYIRYNIAHPNFLLWVAFYFGVFSTFLVIIFGLIQIAKKQEKPTRIKQPKNEIATDNKPLAKEPEKQKENEIDELKKQKARIYKRLNPTKNKEKRQILLKQIKSLNEKIKNIGE